MGNIKAKTHLEKLGFSDSDKKKSEHDIIQEWVCDNIEKIISETVMSKNPHPFKITEVKWEHQVMFTNGNYKMVVGFIDIMVHVDGMFYYHKSNEYENDTLEVFIEIKTEIPILGELIRQMRAYQAYQNRRTYYLIVSPDDRFIKTLNEQGFLFYKYTNPNLLF